MLRAVALPRRGTSAALANAVLRFLPRTVFVHPPLELHGGTPRVPGAATALLAAPRIAGSSDWMKDDGLRNSSRPAGAHVGERHGAIRLDELNFQDPRARRVGV
jgi:hypothetical protein